MTIETGIENAGAYIDSLDDTYPAGGDDLVEGDNHIRGIKNTLLNTFANITGAVTATHTELNQLASRTLTSTDDKIDNFPSGTLMLFQQTAAPTGWTKQVTHNNKALRVVSGTAGSGGTHAFSTVFGRTATDSHTLNTNQIPGHAHSIPDHNHVQGGAFNSTTASATDLNGNVNTGSESGTTATMVGSTTFGGGSYAHYTFNKTNLTTNNNTGGGGGHTHNMDIRVQYVDLILASKD